MDEVLELCTRLLGDRGTAARAAQLARSPEGEDRRHQLARAVAACRRTGEEREPTVAADGAGDGERAGAGDPELASAIAGELAAATSRLPQRQREALALRELLRCRYDEVADVIGIEPMAVAPLLARARLRLRGELRGTAPAVRGTAPAAGDCAERDRALRTIASRQDGEPVLAADADWLLEHLGHCVGCAQAHAALLEASVCYRAWRVPPSGRIP